MQQLLKNLALGFYYILLGMAVYITGTNVGGFFAIVSLPVVFFGLEQCLASWKREKH